ncbi:head maturation protease, ClpP-related [Bacillus sp. FJAT-45037]|uniref:head maturation protease, ClpP-related n=1 Tax=Bacillus sp. FJAT-45037 TaxID=2011007 RepID=UPI000C241882|nr:head maturation protease, ClpP-related [Bacillus sp. FJAT-45037]
MTKTIDIKGPIISNDEAWIYELFVMDATYPKLVSQKLADANGEDVIISINSPGGYVDDGSEIYTALKNYPGHVEAQIVGLAASAASIIAMGADKVRISPTAQIMIHNASMVSWGDHRDLEKAAKVLRTTDKSLVNAYIIKSGKSEEDLLEMMAEETWMGAQQALEHNFVDEIMFTDNTVKLTASTTEASMIPSKVIEGLRNKMANKKNFDNPAETNDFVTVDSLKEMFSDFKNELKNEFKQTKELEPKPTKQNKGFW